MTDVTCRFCGQEIFLNPWLFTPGGSPPNCPLWCTERGAWDYTCPAVVAFGDPELYQSNNHAAAPPLTSDLLALLELEETLR